MPEKCISKPDLIKELLNPKVGPRPITIEDYRERNSHRTKIAALTCCIIAITSENAGGVLVKI